MSACFCTHCLPTNRVLSQVHNGFAYSPLHVPGIDLANTPLYTFSNFTPQVSGFTPNGNALGLDISNSPSNLSPQLFDESDYYPGLLAMPSAYPRQHLPQIITENLESPTMTYIHSSSPELSPYHLSAASSTGGHPPLSAATSTPSSAGYPTIPMTPRSLPPASHIALPAANGLLTPHSPYAPYAHFPAEVSPKNSTTLLHVPSPASSSRAELSDDDGVGTHPLMRVERHAIAAVGQMLQRLDVPSSMPSYLC